MGYEKLDGETLIANPPNTGPRMEQVWAFISRDQNGHESVCGSLMGELGTQPLMTGNPNILRLMMPMAQRLRDASKGSGKTIHLVAFSNRQEIEQW